MGGLRLGELRFGESLKTAQLELGGLSWVGWVVWVFLVGLGWAGWVVWVGLFGLG